MILFGERLVQSAAEILQRVLLNNILQVKRTHQLWNDEDVTTYGWGAVSDLGGSFAGRGFKLGHRHCVTTTKAIKTAPFN